MTEENVLVKESAFGTEPVGKLISKFAIPCVISLVVNGLYNIVDQIFIFIVVGIATGAQPIIGFNRGAGNFERVMKAFKICVISAAVASIAALYSERIPDGSKYFCAGDRASAAGYDTFFVTPDPVPDSGGDDPAEIPWY